MSKPLLAQLLSDHIGPWLKERGFRRSGLTFIRDLDEVAWVINYQRTEGRGECERFTVNFGVASLRLIRSDERLDPGRLVVELCHWRLRLGRLIDPPIDAWWQLCGSGSVEPSAVEQRQLLAELALPRLATIDSDRALASLWATGVSPGLTAAQREHYLAALRPPGPIADDAASCDIPAR
jgi:uncharacterized protein DUF4304